MVRALLTFLGMTVVVVLAALPAAVVGLVYRFEGVRLGVERIFAGSLMWMTGARLRAEGVEIHRGGPPAFYVGNHQSAMDIPVLMAALDGDVRFMAKHTLFWIPVLGWFMTLYGFAPIDRADPRRAKRSLDKLVERVRAKPASWAVFPEGTRSAEGKLLPFRQGTMKICVRAGLPIVPFAIDGSHRVHRPRALCVRPGVIRVVFGDAIPAETCAQMSSKALNQLVHDRVAECLRRARRDDSSAAQEQIAGE